MAGTTFTSNNPINRSPSPLGSNMGGQTQTQTTTTLAMPIPIRPNARDVEGMKINTPPLLSRSANDARLAGPASRTFSPVNENGCFEFDRVLKAGDVHKRTRKTKQWKPVHLVLRPNKLSIYADTDGTKLRHQIQLSDLTAIARQRDPKKKAKHVFALFSPERNYHIEAPSDAEAQKWVEMIRSEARINEEEDGVIALMSPGLEQPPGMESGFFGPRRVHTAGSTSASEVETQPIQIRKSRSRVDMHSSTRKPSVGHHTNTSGAEAASFSDFSDTGAAYPESTLSLSVGALGGQTQAEREERERKMDEIFHPSKTTDQRPSMQRNLSAMSTSRAAQQGAPADSERVVYNGYLLLLKSKGGVRQWKSVWAVLRAKSLALYKNEEEYQPLHIIPFASILEAVDIDNVSKHKKHCFQVITEEKHFKFCAKDEEQVAQWVGGFKSLLAKRREVERSKEEERKEYMSRSQLDMSGKGKQPVQSGLLR